jgi:hypothetical protein
VRHNGIEEDDIMKSKALLLSVIAMALVPGAAKADEGSESVTSDHSGFGLALTLGEGMYFVHGDVYRQQVTFEVVPSFGWSWFKIDLGLYIAFEDLWIPGVHAGSWNFTFRPGGRVTPPMIPLYFRFAFPLQIQRDYFDYGVLFGLGVDIPVLPILGIVLEVDTTLTNDLDWGGIGVPLEFRAGVAFHF